MLTTTRQSGVRPAYAAEGDPPSKRKIMQTALRLFAERGLHAVTVRNIADEAGYTNPALFKFFDSKDALALYLFECCYLDLYEKLRAETKPPMPFRDRLGALVMVSLQQLDADASSVLFVQDHLRELWPRAPKRIRSRSIVGLVHSILLDGVEEGAIDAGSNLDLLTATIIGTLAQFARVAYFGAFKRPAAQYAAEMTEILCKAALP